MKHNIRNIFTSCVGILILAYLIHHQYTIQQRQDTPPMTTTGTQVAPAQATLQFQETIFDFGKIEAGTIVKHAYIFTNTGTQALVIQEVIPSCKLCTQASATQLVVQPGNQGVIMVEFNSTGRVGRQGKYVTIWSNVADSPTRVLIRGEISQRGS
jgi:hypothetical protein